MKSPARVRVGLSWDLNPGGLASVRYVRLSHLAHCLPGSQCPGAARRRGSETLRLRFELLGTGRTQEDTQGGAPGTGSSLGPNSRCPQGFRES